MRLIASVLCLCLFPVSALAQTPTKGAEQKYTDAKAEYAEMQAWTKSTFNTALSHADKGDELSACAHFKGSREGATEQISILNDVIRYGEAAQKDVTGDREELAVTQNTHKSLTELVAARCGPGTQGDPHTVYAQLIETHLKNASESYKQFGQYLDAGHGFGSKPLCDALYVAVHEIADANDTMEVFVAWARQNSETLSQEALNYEAQIPGLYKTMSDQYIEACSSRSDDDYEYDYDE